MNGRNDQIRVQRGWKTFFEISGRLLRFAGNGVASESGFRWNRGKETELAGYYGIGDCR